MAWLAAEKEIRLQNLCSLGCLVWLLRLLGLGDENVRGPGGGRVGVSALPRVASQGSSTGARSGKSGWCVQIFPGLENPQASIKPVFISCPVSSCNSSQNLTWIPVAFCQNVTEVSASLVSVS